MAFPDRSLTLGPLEKHVLAVLWTNDEVTVRQMQSALSNEGVTLAYTTVMTVLVRLAAKGFASRVKYGKQFSYRAKIGELELSEKLGRSFARLFLGPEGNMAFAGFVDELAKTSPERLAELQRLASEATEPA